MPFTRLDRGTYLHDRPRPDVFRLLIDCYRLRMEDNKNIDGIVEPDSIYGGAATGREGFRRFLGRAAQRQGLLPGWWDDAAAAACEALGMDAAEGNWYSLGRRVTKTSVIEHYGDRLMPMQLRMLGEGVYGRSPGGQDGTAMRKQMAQMERDG
jgi:splicing suppressor protein 51